MFKKHHGRRSQNPLFVLFRLFLSLIMFAVLLGGIYSAYKHFSGLDPLKLDPQVIARQLLSARTPQQLVTVLSSFKLSPKVLSGGTKILGEANITQAPLMGLTNQAVPVGSVAFKFLLVADSHNDNANLAKAIFQAKSIYPDTSFIIGLGDYTDVGTLNELKNAKTEFDKSGLRYFLLAGDHDLWDARDKKGQADYNFKQIFGPTYQSFNYQNFKFLLLDNADNYEGISKEQTDWITDQLEKSKEEGVRGIFVFIHSPLFHPSSDRFMGKVDNSLKSQAQSLIYQLKNAGVKKVFSGDIHYFSEYEEPVTKISMMTSGAITIERNPQAPRYAVVSVYEDGLSRVDDVEIK